MKILNVFNILVLNTEYIIIFSIIYILAIEEGRVINNLLKKANYKSRKYY